MRRSAAASRSLSICSAHAFLLSGQKQGPTDDGDGSALQKHHVAVVAIYVLQQLADPPLIVLGHRCCPQRLRQACSRAANSHCPPVVGV